MAAIKQTITINGSDNQTAIEADVLGGLAIHKSVTGRGWTLTHAPCGKSVSVFGYSKTQALGLREALLALGDWDRPEEELYQSGGVAHEHRQEIGEAISKSREPLPKREPRVYPTQPIVVKTWKDNQPNETTIEAEVDRGLALHLAVGYAGRWSVTHIASGMGMGLDLPSRGKAQRRMKALLAMGLDWTQGKDYVMAHAEAIREVFKETA